jgi:hypothetical protein
MTYWCVADVLACICFVVLDKIWIVEMVVSILFRSSAISYYEAGLVVNVED